jgi:hypothetical protein
MQISFYVLFISLSGKKQFIKIQFWAEMLEVLERYNQLQDVQGLEQVLERYNQLKYIGTACRKAPSLHRETLNLSFWHHLILWTQPSLNYQRNRYKADTKPIEQWAPQKWDIIWPIMMSYSNSVTHFLLLHKANTKGYSISCKKLDNCTPQTKPATIATPTNSTHLSKCT